MTGPGEPPGGTVRGVGVDAVDIDRLRRALARRPGLAERIFTEEERAFAARSTDPGPRLAARFAAKEAVAKALGVGMSGVAWREVEVVRDQLGAPGVALSGRAAELAAGRGVGRWHLSLSHTGTLALATAVAMAEGGPGCVSEGGPGCVSEGGTQP